MILGSERPINQKELEKFTEFTRLDKPEHAYLLGFLWADGYIGQKYNSNIEIAKKDFDDIYPIINDLFNWQTSFRHRKDRQPQASLRLNNKPFYQFLFNHDYKKKNKVSPEKILTKIPSQFHPQWWHGYFDGDGSFYTNSKWSIYQVVFTASYDYSWDYQLSYLSRLGICKHKVKQSKTKQGHSYSQLRITNKDGCMAFLDYIYKNSPISGLSRKHKTYMKVLG